MFAAIALLGGARSAAAATTSIDLPRWQTPASQGQFAGPVLTADGSAVFALQRSARSIDILRLAPGAQQPHTVTSVPVPAGRAWGARVLLAAAGDGFLLFRAQIGATVRCCFEHIFDPLLTWHPTPDAAGTEIPLCTGGACNDCGNTVWPTVALAADSTHAVVSPRCFYGGGTARGPFVRDLASGEEQPFSLGYTQDVHLAGPYLSYWGGSETDPSTGLDREVGRVVEWRTGAVLREIDHLRQHALLADGTLLYATSDHVGVWRWDASASGPVELPAVQPFIESAAGDRFLTRDYVGAQRRLHVWTLDGTPVAGLDDVPGTLAFDGNRVVYLEPVCMTVRLQFWDVDGAAPVSLSPVCGPVRVGRVELRRRARVELSCPQSVPQGCIGSLGLVDPPRAHRGAFLLHAGERRWVAVTARLSPRRCRTLAKKRIWSVDARIDSAFGQQSSVARRRPAVDCG